MNNKWGSVPPLGKFLSPQHGFWQNAEACDYDFSENLALRGLKGKANVYFDQRLVPHVFAEQDVDAYFIQGYLHAKFRLWQMEFQTMAAAGRISEILGKDERFIHFDREQRRLGMTYAAENALKEMGKDKASKQFFDAYSSGVNAYISSLSEKELPIEYKLLDYRPELWSNKKIALFLKQMSKTLAGFDRDFEFTNLHTVFTEQEMRILFPSIDDSLKPIIPKGTAFAPPSIVPVKPSSVDSLYLNNDTTVKAKEIFKPDRKNGSNSWAVSGQKTKSGAPIFCNDPHLDLTLPSIWYEMQLTTPTMNVYGATFPGSPSVIIGFNDSIAFGFTNAQRDVKDYYRVRFKDDSKKEYWFDSSWKAADLRVEEIKIKGEASYFDTVAYTVFGPVMFDESFGTDISAKNSIALRWSAHDPSNEGAMWFKLNRAQNYSDFLTAIKSFNCPGQNITFASKSGDISIWQQGKFPARWGRQGLYIMPGEDSSYMWQGYIPQSENPHVLNPVEGFVQSANQRPVDSLYPYFIPGNYLTPRGITLFNKLSQMQQVTPRMMMILQNDCYSSLASEAVPMLLKNVDRTNLSQFEKINLNEIAKWNYIAAPDSKAATIYQTWMDSLKAVIWNDEWKQFKEPVVTPDENTMIEILLRDSASKYIDDVSTPYKETLELQVTKAFKLAMKELNMEKNTTDLVWWKHKNPTIYHLLKSSLMPFARTGIKVGGWNNTLNAVTSTHGPSWRMIVHLTSPTEAYGIYPGGQSGNPGSKYYDNFVSNWAAGKYYPLWIMKESEKSDERIKFIIKFSNI
ncbi:penicillin acylase family protein [Chitinophagaceae bacterium LB-8]|uniref:Penicillin acylase family protein n=1 Tax=Paraflavisolibacter caeni TaxID=2982496 RepID=A0A9X3BH93_9BACT|nr:penicillin acylase family protein [Paraflavisolibacter caeni]MCU7549172.1 penicillin acylase family protein [Paraflavisolibacter caeni]